MAEVGLPCWQPGVWADTVWADGVWADESTPAVTGGVVWATVNGVVTPPARQTSGSQTHWMVSNGTWIVPTVKPAPRPRSFSKDRT